jgi:hypothetical protein
MTEAEWLTCADPGPMLQYVGEELGHRKLRLYSVACCRLILHLMPDDRALHALEVAERYVDDLATIEELRPPRTLPATPAWTPSTAATASAVTPPRRPRRLPDRERTCSASSAIEWPMSS